MTARSNWRHAMPTAEAYAVDRVLFDVHHDPVRLARYLQDVPAYLDAHPLSATSRQLLLEGDIGGLYLAGVNPYLLRAHALGTRMPEDVFLASIRAVAEEANHG